MSAQSIIFILSRFVKLPDVIHSHQSEMNLNYQLIIVYNVYVYILFLLRYLLLLLSYNL